MAHNDISDMPAYCAQGVEHGTAKRRCVECDSLMCEECVAAHASISPLDEHTVVDEPEELDVEYVLALSLVRANSYFLTNSQI